MDNDPLVFGEDEREREGRQLVACDERCNAFREPDPKNAYEVYDAYVHWRFHDYLSGCSHGS